jgi:hypothetical protein
VGPDERFPFPEPDSHRWTKIDAGLARRLAGERRVRRADGRGALATSLAAVVVCGLMLAGGSWDERGPVSPGRNVLPTAAASDDDRTWSVGLDAANGLDWSDPTRADAGGPAPVPDLDALDGREREELLDWIRDEMSRIDGDSA